MGSPTYLEAVRTAYDTVAESYAAQLRSALAATPWDRAVLGAFAEVVAGPVADVGCGPGRITAPLAELGVSVYGFDLSPGMIAAARATYPALPFSIGSLLSLPVADGALGGIVAWYSIIHTPPAELPAVFAGFRRAVRAGGHLLLAFQVGDSVVHVTQAYGHELSVVDAYRLSPDRIAAMLGVAGFSVEAQLVRAPAPAEQDSPTPPETTPQAYLLARALPG